MARTFVSASTQSLDIGQATSLNSPTTLTVLGWIRTTIGAGIFQRIFSADQHLTPFQGWAIGQGYSPGAAGTLSYYNNILGAWVASTAAHNNGAWRHVGISITGTGASGGHFWLDGATNGVWTHSNPSTSSTTNKLFGARDGNTTPYLDATLAHWAIWNVALNAGEIAALAAGLPPNMVRPAALLGYWPMDGLASPEPELSGKPALNGTLNGTPAMANGPPMAIIGFGAGDVTAAASIFSAAITEAGSAADAVTETTTAAVSLTEAGAATDAATAVTASLAITEAASAIDAVSEAAIASAARTEAGAAADAQTAIQTTIFAVSITESVGDFSPDFTDEFFTLGASESSSATAIAAVARTEAATAAEVVSATSPPAVIEVASGVATQSETTTAAAARTESGSAADVPNATSITAVSRTEAGSAADATSAVASAAVAGLIEAAAATDATSAVTASARTEAAAAADSASEATVASRSITEAGSAADAVGAGGGNAAITEPAAASDVPSEALISAASITEAATATDATITDLIASIIESATAADASTETTSADTSITETASADDTETVGPDINEAAAAADVTTATTALLVAIIEAGGATDATSEISASSQAITEPASAVATQTTALVATISESALAADVTSGPIVAAVARIEAGNATDSASVGLFTTRTEAASATDTASEITVVAAGITEAAIAADATSEIAAAAVTRTETAAAATSTTADAPGFSTEIEVALAADASIATMAVSVARAEASGATDAPTATIVVPMAITEAAAATTSQATTAAAATVIHPAAGGSLVFSGYAPTIINLSSGTLSLTNSDILIEAFGRIRVPPTAITRDHLLSGRTSINLEVQSWTNESTTIWSVVSGTIQLVLGQITYQLPANLVDMFELTMLDAYGNTAFLLPMERTRYAAVVNKMTVGNPSFYWLQKLRPAQITLWPAPALPKVLTWYGLQQIQDSNLGAAEIPNVPYRGIDALCARVALRLCDKFGPKDRKAKAAMKKEKIALAAIAWEKFQRRDQEQGPTSIRLETKRYRIR